MPGHYWLELRIKGNTNITENLSSENADQSDQPSKIFVIQKQLLILEFHSILVLDFMKLCSSYQLKFQTKLTIRKIVYMNTEEPLRIYVTQEENKASNIENLYREENDPGRFQLSLTTFI